MTDATSMQESTENSFGYSLKNLSRDQALLKDSLFCRVKEIAQKGLPNLEKPFELDLLPNIRVQCGRLLDLAIDQGVREVVEL